MEAHNNSVVKNPVEFSWMILGDCYQMEEYWVILKLDTTYPPMNAINITYNDTQYIGNRAH
jgi:hypothetical protein